MIICTLLEATQKDFPIEINLVKESSYDFYYTKLSSLRMVVKISVEPNQDLLYFKNVFTTAQEVARCCALLVYT